MPGATPKNPYSGLIAYRRPSSPIRIHAISSPTHSIFHPGRDDFIIAKFVFPHALGNAAAKYRFSPSGFVIPTMSICSAIHFSSRPFADAIRSAKHFFPKRALPPYPLPNDQISLASGKWTMYLSSGLQGQTESSSPCLRGTPTECKQGTNSPSVPKTSSAFFPIRVIIYVLATT